MAATVVYWRDSPTGAVAMALMCGGDGLADVVGRRLGPANPLPWNPAKSWAGSAAMLLGGPPRLRPHVGATDDRIQDSEPLAVLKLWAQERA